MNAEKIQKGIENINFFNMNGTILRTLNMLDDS